MLYREILNCCIFFQVSKEKDRFEKLMEYFINDDNNIDFMVGRHLNQQSLMLRAWIYVIFSCHRVCLQVACMQFINIVVHSVENMNFRVHLQYEFTHLGLDKYLEVNIKSEFMASNAFFNNKVSFPSPKRKKVTFTDK